MGKTLDGKTLPTSENHDPVSTDSSCRKTKEGASTFAFVSLGCPKNLVDSERMLGLLAGEGYVPVSDPKGADMVIVNTCAFIESSRQESKAVIREMTDMKERGEVGGVIVTGCLAERMGPQIISEIPLVDHAVGVFGRDEIVKVADRFMNGSVEHGTVFGLCQSRRWRIPLGYASPRGISPISKSPRAVIGHARFARYRIGGKHVTKSIESIVAEAEELVRDGSASWWSSRKTRPITEWTCTAKSGSRS